MKPYHKILRLGSHLSIHIAYDYPLRHRTGGRGENKRSGSGITKDKTARCKFCGTSKDLTIHHIDLKGDPNNTIVLCRKCHNAVHYAERLV